MLSREKRDVTNNDQKKVTSTDETTGSAIYDLKESNISCYARASKETCEMIKRNKNNREDKINKNSEKGRKEVINLKKIHQLG